MARNIRSVAEKIVLAVSVSVGIAVTVADLFGWLDGLFPAGTLPKITLLILSTVTLFLLLEIDRFKMIDVIHERLSKLDIDAIAQKFKNDRYAGVVRVHERFPEATFIDYLESAEQEVRILQTWIPNLHRFQQALQDAIVNRRVLVHILLLHPKSPVADLREKALARDPALNEDVEKDVERCLSILHNIYNKIDDKGLLKVRVYNSLPSIAVYRADGHYFVSSFLHGQLAVDSPQIEIDGGDTVMGRQVQHELEMLWDIGHDIDLRNWRRSLEAIPVEPDREVVP